MSNIEYFTDSQGGWYIWDWDLEAAYCIELAQDEYELYSAEVYVYWDGVGHETEFACWYSVTFPTQAGDSPDSWSSWSDADGCEHVGNN